VSRRPGLAAESVAALVALAAGALLFALNRHVRSDSIFSFWTLLEDVAPPAAFFVTGFVLRARRPGNLVGGLCFALGAFGFVSWLLTEYAGYGLITHPGSLPGALGIEVALQGSWALEIGFLVLLACVFPNGRLLPGWRIVPAGGIVAFGGIFLLGMTTAPSAPFQHVHNPLHVPGTPLIGIGAFVLVPLMIASTVGALAAVAVRFRRAEADEREQLKWLMLAASALPIGLVVHSIADSFAPGADGTIEFVNSLAVIGVPVAIGVAVLKYRLYDIDRIVSRTLVYGVLSALLASSYFAIVLALQAAFGSVTQGNELAVACSTLVVAALFRPLRRRVQEMVDRRFYRSRVNGEETLARFAARVRNEADLETLLAELRAVVGITLAPAHVSLWLRTDAELARNASETATE
jgi:hypothetical protein